MNLKPPSKQDIIDLFENPDYTPYPSQLESEALAYATARIYRRHNPTSTRPIDECLLDDPSFAYNHAEEIMNILVNPIDTHTVERLEEWCWLRLNPDVMMEKSWFEPDIWFTAASSILTSRAEDARQREIDYYEDTLKHLIPRNMPSIPDIRSCQAEIGRATEAIIASVRLSTGKSTQKLVRQIAEKEAEVSQLEKTLKQLGKQKLTYTIGSEEYNECKSNIKAVKAEIDELSEEIDELEAQVQSPEPEVNELYVVAREAKQQWEDVISDVKRLTQIAKQIDAFGENAYKPINPKDFTLSALTKDLREKYNDLATEMSSHASAQREQISRVVQRMNKVLLDKGFRTPRLNLVRSYPEYRELPQAIYARSRGLPYDTSRSEVELIGEPGEYVRRALPYRLIYDTNLFVISDTSRSEVEAIQTPHGLVPRNAFVTGLVRVTPLSTEPGTQSGLLTVHTTHYAFESGIPYLRAVCSCGTSIQVAWEVWKTGAIVECGNCDLNSPALPHDHSPIPVQFLDAWAVEDVSNYTPYAMGAGVRVNNLYLDPQDYRESW